MLEKHENRAARISKYKMINFDDYTNENKKENNPKWPYISDHPYRILIIGGSGSGKAMNTQMICKASIKILNIIIEKKEMKY